MPCDEEQHHHHHRRHHRSSPSHPPKARTRHTAEREQRKAHGTPERSRRRRSRERDREGAGNGSPERRRRRHSGERSPRKEREAQKRREERSPERRTRRGERSSERYARNAGRSPERECKREEIVVEYASVDEGESLEGIPPRPAIREQQKRERRYRSPERKTKTVVEEKHESYDSYSTVGSTAPLSLDALAKLDAMNEKGGDRAQERVREKKEKKYSVARSVKEKVVTGRVGKEKIKRRRKSESRYRDEKRRVSGPLLEDGREGRRRRGGYVDPEADDRRWWRRFGRKTWIALGLLLLLIIIIVVAVVVSKKNSGSGGGDGSSKGDPSNSNLDGVNKDDIPTSAKNTVLDPFTWYDTTDLNVTYTNDTVGGLSVMGLNSAWDDSAQANSDVPPLNKPWSYGKMPIRGVNVGGWLSIEPFITPSLFNAYKPNDGIVDEWTLTTKLGATQAAQTLEKHYSKFITEDDFAAIQAAGFDHVRIPYSYWAVTTYSGDPYVPKISWRYLLRGIEYARKYGLRVNLDLHALPGSQNGWNHSGKQGDINWLNGTDGDTNAQRSLDLHTQLSTFFAQDRYKNVITIYGLVNEPKMTELPISDVVSWTTKATQIVRKSGMKQTVAFGDGFLGLTKWQGQLQGVDGLVLDAHEYVIFDAGLISKNHKDKVDYACAGWTGQMKQSLDKTTGFGPTLCGEWSQADTDCTTYLNDVGAGTRWEGTLHSTDRSPSVLTPSCPAKSSACSCSSANADPSSYSDAYKSWLKTNAEAQMASYETAWGWFYWTWTTESATQWDWKAGMAAGILPKKVSDRNFKCSGSLPSFDGLSENY
ncbi:hypothetical protein ACLMJK_007823 [Lecanora helva]